VRIGRREDASYGRSKSMRPTEMKFTRKKISKEKEKPKKEDRLEF
jgi:hypothetical protein